MTRDELLSSTEYWQEQANIAYWRAHKDDVQEDNGQICDAFEAGWDKSKEYFTVLDADGKPVNAETLKSACEIVRNCTRQKTIDKAWNLFNMPHTGSWTKEEFEKAMKDGNK